MQKFIIVFIFISLFSYADVKEDIIKYAWVSTQTEIIKQEDIPDDVVLEYTVIFELLFYEKDGVLITTEMFTLDGKIIQKNISKEVFMYRLDNNKIILYDGLEFEYQDFLLVLNIEDEVLLFKPRPKESEFKI